MLYHSIHHPLLGETMVSLLLSRLHRLLMWICSLFSINEMQIVLSLSCIQLDQRTPSIKSVSAELS